MHLLNLTSEHGTLFCHYSDRSPSAGIASISVKNKQYTEGFCVCM